MFPEVEYTRSMVLKVLSTNPDDLKRAARRDKLHRLQTAVLLQLGRPHCSPKSIDDGECKGNHPLMAELFRLVNYSNLA